MSESKTNNESKSNTKCECKPECECEDRMVCKEGKCGANNIEKNNNKLNSHCDMLADANIATKNNTALTAKNLIIETSLSTKIPADEIILKQLEDGFSLKVQHSHSAKSDSSWYESAFSYQKEEHYNRKVKEVSGRFNEEKNYQVEIEFEE